MGHSAGAHLAALVAIDDRFLEAVGKDHAGVNRDVGKPGDQLTLLITQFLDAIRDGRVAHWTEAQRRSP